MSKLKSLIEEFHKVDGKYSAYVTIVGRLLQSEVKSGSICEELQEIKPEVEAIDDGDLSKIYLRLVDDCGRTMGKKPSEQDLLEQRKRDFRKYKWAQQRVRDVIEKDYNDFVTRLNEIAKKVERERHRVMRELVSMAD